MSADVADAGLLIDMAWLYLKLSFLCIGGTIPLIPDMHRFFVESRGLMTTQQFAGYVALAQAAPGPNILYVALLGHHVGGITGALTTLGAISVGPFVLVSLAARVFSRLAANPWRETVLAGLAPVTVGLMLAGCLLLLRGVADTWAALLFGAALAAFLLFPRLNPLVVLAVAAIVGSVSGL